MKIDCLRYTKGQKRQKEKDKPLKHHFKKESDSLKIMNDWDKNGNVNKEMKDCFLRREEWT